MTSSSIRFIVSLLILLIIREKTAKELNGAVLIFLMIEETLYRYRIVVSAMRLHPNCAVLPVCCTT